LTLPEPELTPDDIVDLGHRLILGRPPDAAARAQWVSRLRDKRTDARLVWTGLVIGEEFGHRVAHQRAIIREAQPEVPADQVDVDAIRRAKTITEHNAAAEAYFASQDAATAEAMLAKPYASGNEATELLTCFAHMVNGLEIVAGDRLLDFAAGTGWTSWMFAQLGCEVICSDVAPSALDLARRRFERWPLLPGRVPPSFLEFDGLRIDLPDESVDKICCFDAFHHLINQPAVMAEFARILRPGGLAGFDEPGPHHSKLANSQFEMRTYGVVEGDIELGEMVAMARAAGLEFVAANVLTVRPIWAGPDAFADLVDHRVPDAMMAQHLAHQISNKQQFVLRKPGGAGKDSRDSSALGAGLALRDVRFDSAGDDITATLTLSIHNSGSARWLPSDQRVGGVSLRGRSSTRPGWEVTLVPDGNLELAPGEHRDLTARAVLPAALAGQELSVNLVSEAITWFDLCGVAPILLRLPD
jgi:SAM-dependent methyltransferase